MLVMEFGRSVHGADIASIQERKALLERLFVTVGNGQKQSDNGSTKVNDLQAKVAALDKQSENDETARDESVTVRIYPVESKTP